MAISRNILLAGAILLYLALIMLLLTFYLVAARIIQSLI